MKIIEENILLEERPQDIQAFNDKFGDGSFDKFNKLKGRLKNNNISQDIVFHTKNTSKEDMDKILYDMENRVVRDKTTGEAKNNYKLVAENEHYKVLDILDWETAMNLGNDTGWCITGRYQTGGEVKPSQAKQYFNEYKENGVEHYLFFMPKGNEEKYCLCINEDGDFEFWNADDESFGYNEIPSDENLPEFTYDGFTLKVSKIVNGLVIQNDIVVKVVDKSITDVVIPDGVEEIGNYAFEECESLKSITIPNSVKYIGGYAFYRCYSLQSITFNIPDNLKYISGSAFEGCKSLKSIKIPNSVKEIGSEVFARCKSLKSITIPDSVTRIGGHTFSNCPNLTVYTNNKYVQEYCEEWEIPYKPLQTNENINNKNLEVKEKMNTKINIREELNKIDNDTFNEYDLRNMYDSCEWTKEEKKKIVESLKDVSKLNRIISGKFFGIKEPVKTKKVLNESVDNSKTIYRIKYWETEEDRDWGNSEIFLDKFTDLESAKRTADKLFDEYASVEVVTDLDTDDEEVVYGRYPDEPINEDYTSDYHEKGYKHYKVIYDTDDGQEDIESYVVAKDDKEAIDKVKKSLEVKNKIMRDKSGNKWRDRNITKYLVKIDESINEKVDNTGWANDYWHSIAVEDENKKKITDWVMSSDSLLQAAYDYYKNDDVDALNDITVEYLDTNYKPIDYYRTFEGSNEFGIRDKKTNELILKSDNVMDINDWEDENNSWSDEDYDNALSLIKKAINEIGYYQWSNEEENESLKEGALTGYWCPDCHSKSLHQTLMVVANKAQEGAPIYKCDDCDKKFYKDINNGEFVELPDSAKVKRYDESLKESTDNKRWEQIVRTYCTKKGYELLFVNDDSFGYEDKDGNMIHKYVDELQAELKGKNESLNESKDSDDVISWWKEVEDANEKKGWGFTIDNGDYEDIDSVHAAMFDMINELKKLDEKELVAKGISIYNKYRNQDKQRKESLNEDKKEQIVILRAENDPYTFKDSAESSCTVGELISALDNYSEDTPVILGFDKRSYGFYSYGAIDADRDLYDSRSLNIEESLKESFIRALYIFPALTDKDKKMLRSYSLTFEKSTDEGDVVTGDIEDIKRYAKDYLDYELNSDYLYDNAEDCVLYGESLKESTAENIKDGSKDYTGKPFSDFLQDIDHRSRLWVEYKNYPGSDVSWNFANCPIVSIEVPEDDRFNDFKVVIDASNALRGINESLKENYRSATSQDFSDIKVEKIVRGKLPKDKNESLKEGYETIHCPNMSFEEIKDYCDAYECYVKNTGKVGEYTIYGIDSARVVDDLKADGLCEE